MPKERSQSRHTDIKAPTVSSGNNVELQKEKSRILESDSKAEFLSRKINYLDVNVFWQDDCGNRDIEHVAVSNATANKHWPQHRQKQSLRVTTDLEKPNDET